MTALGDSLTALAIFAVLSAPVSALALYWARPYPWFWQGALGFAIPIVATSLIAALAFLPAFRASAHTWVMAAPLRILLAPIVGLLFLLIAIFCPRPAYRLAFLAATAIEAVVFIGVVIYWMAGAQ
jgi:hypothetical protein